MLLKIRASSANADARVAEESTFEQYPVVLGRSSDCDLVLPDENKYVSSKHAQISLSGDTLTIFDTSSNGTFVNNSTTPIGRGNSAPLANGDLLSIGEFSLQITIASSQSAAASAIDDPFGDISPNAVTEKSNDPFADFENTAGSSTPASHSSDHIDRLEDKGIGPSAWETDSGDEPFADIQSASASSASDPFATDPIQPADAAKTDTDDDWAGWLGSVPDQPPANPVVSIPQPQTPAPAATGGSSPNDNLAVLLKSAGLNPDHFSSADQAALAAHIGGILKKSTQSMMLLLRSRDEIKNAMRADVTLLASKSNSPLQFSISVEDALQKLLSPTASTGFSDANKAIDKGLQDIKIHQLAMLEAMRSALQIALSHFDPEQLEQQIRDTSPLASSLPFAREAKLWEQFQSRYNDIKRETVDDFSDLFGKELRKAYEKSVNELKQPLN